MKLVVLSCQFWLLRLWLFCWCLMHHFHRNVWLLLMNASTCESHRNGIVHLIYHVVPKLYALKLEDEKRILLLVACILY